MERRSHPRVEVSHPVLYFNRICPRPKVSSTLDLSVGGTRIETPYNLILGEILEISIAIHTQVIRCKGEVVHASDSIIHGPKAGIRFEKLSSHDRLHLREYLSCVMAERA